MDFRKTQVCALVAALGLFASCRKAPEPDAPPQLDPQAVVARFAGGEIRRSEITDAVERRLAAVPGPVAPETRRLMVRKVIERRVRAAILVEEARAKGYPDRPEVRLQAQAAEDRLLAADLVAQNVASVQVSDAVVAAAVEPRLKMAQPEEARKFSHIYLRAPESDAAARAGAAISMQKILAELKSGAGFNALAERYSNSVMARGGGRIEWTRQKNLQPDTAKVIFALAEGAVSPIVATRDGLHLFQLDGIRSANPVDVEALRRAVRSELDDEARAVAARAVRQQEMDAAGVEFATPSTLERLSAGEDEWVARYKGGEVRAQEFLAVRGPMSRGAARDLDTLRELVENRLLAALRRAQGLAPELEARLAEARRNAILEAYREALIDEIDTEPKAEEVAGFYREHGGSALFLRDHRLDVLFFPQSGESVADVYAAGEKVVAALRDGRRFDDLLERHLRPNARVCRDVHAIDLEELGKKSLRLRKAILNLAPGDTSAALYLDRALGIQLSGDCSLEGRGVVFVRLREVRTLPLESSRAAIRAVLVKQKESAGIDAVQSRLLESSGLKILLPDG